MTATPTLLELFGIGVPPYSARGLTETLAPIEQSSHLERAIDGSLLNLSYAPFHKYKLTISCSDQQPPAVDGVWAGTLVTVHPVTELGFAEYAGPQREAVPDSLRYEAGFWFYRPILQMMVTSFSLTKDEYGAVVGWQMELEEDGS